MNPKRPQIETCNGHRWAHRRIRRGTAQATARTRPSPLRPIPGCCGFVRRPIRGHPSIAAQARAHGRWLYGCDAGCPGVVETARGRANHRCGLQRQGRIRRSVPVRKFRTKRGRRIWRGRGSSTAMAGRRIWWNAPAG